MSSKSCRPLRRNLPSPSRLLPTRAAHSRCRPLAHKRHPAYPRAPIPRHPAARGASNAIPCSLCRARALKRRYRHARRTAHAYANPTANLSPRRRRPHADNRRQAPCLRVARKRRCPLLGRRPQKRWHPRRPHPNRIPPNIRRIRLHMRTAPRRHNRLLGTEFGRPSHPAARRV